MAVDFREDGNTLTAYLSGEIDHHSAADMRTSIDAKVRNASPTLLILDFARVSFMDSSGVGLIMGRYKLMSFFSGTVKIVNVSERVEKILRMSGIGKLATIERKDEAV